MRRAVVAAAAALVLALALAQVLLPRLAADSVRSRLAKSGRVLNVKVSAFPAVTLLWHHATRVSVRLVSFTSSAGSLSELVGESADVGSLRATVSTLHTGLLTLTDVDLEKTGDQLSGTAHISQSALRAAVPFLQSLAVLRSGGGVVTLQGTSTLLGIRATATIEPQRGRLVLIPDLPLVGGILSLNLFSAPGLDVQSVSADPVPGGLALSARGRLS